MFVISKLLTGLTQPAFWLALWWLCALLLLPYRRRGATVMLWLGLAGLGLLGFRAIPDALLRPLENAYPIPTNSAQVAYTGVIVLGGAVGHPHIFTDRRTVPLRSSAERMSVSAGLMHTHPNLQLIFAGGEGRLLTATGVSEAVLAEKFYAEQGIARDRIRFERTSRNTRENARNVAAMLGAHCTGAWLLITSAWHMPRAMAEFDNAFQTAQQTPPRKTNQAPCTITPYPVDFRTAHTTLWHTYTIAHSLTRWQTALHEWLGIWVYRATR